LLPRLGAALTVVVSLTGQIIMGVTIDALGWFDAKLKASNLFNILGILLLIVGIFLMNYVKDRTKEKANIPFYLWMLAGFIIGFGPPIQTAINSKLGQEVNSSFMAAFISFTVGFIILLLLKTIESRHFKLEIKDRTQGKLSPVYFIGGALGLVYITVNIFLMPYLGAALTTVSGMLGQMILALVIDHFGLLGIRKRKVTSRKLVSIGIIIVGILFLRLF
ncbi:MAG TPA: DMT family transporter, partial [Tissierellaceae bacterium]|nr:DMT family transporter [Tissierellaceae bacterium]